MNILLIFTGLFIVVDNLDSTGLPRAAWNAIVGKRPFKTTGSVIGISIFVLIASQTVGNVPVIQLAKPNVEVKKPPSLSHPSHTPYRRCATLSQLTTLHIHYIYPI